MWINVNTNHLMYLYGIFSRTRSSCLGIGNKNKPHERLLILAMGLSNDCLRPAGLGGAGGVIIFSDSIRPCADKPSQCEPGWAWIAWSFCEVLCQLCMVHSLSPRASAV